MKKIFPLALAILCATLTSCGGDGSTGPDSNTAAMACKIDGAAWTANSIGKSGFAPGALIVGTAQKNGLSELLGLQLDTVVAGRTIQVGSDSLSFSAPNAYLTRSDGTWETRNGSGSVTITEVAGGRVKGTFSFTLYKGGKAGADSLKVTEGTFNSLF